MDKKIIVLIVETMEKGVGRHVMDLFNNLNLDDKIECYVLYGSDRIAKEYDGIQKHSNFIEIKNLKRKIGINDFKSIFEIKKELLKLKPDIVHCHSSKAGLSGRIAAKLAHVQKILYSPHAYFFLNYKKGSIKRWIFLNTEKILSKFFTNYTVVTSKGEQNIYLSNKIDKSSKSKLIEHGIKENEISHEHVLKMKEKLGIPQDAIIVGSMARLEEQKNPVGILEILKRVVEKEPKCYGVIFGNGSKYEELYDMHQKYEFKKKIVLAGETKEHMTALKLMDIYLTASLYEGLPYTIIEVLSLKKPIVVSDVEGNQDCVIDEKNGYKFEKYDYDEASEKILQIIKNNDIQLMGEQSYEIFNKRFSLKSMIDNYKKIYLGELQ